LSMRIFMGDAPEAFLDMGSHGMGVSAD